MKWEEEEKPVVTAISSMDTFRVRSRAIERSIRLCTRERVWCESLGLPKYLDEVMQAEIGCQCELVHGNSARPKVRRYSCRPDKDR
jgi:hypothetical protein